MVKFRVLGPLEVVHEDVSVTPSATKPRTVLALLAINANTVVPLDAIIAELWGEATPRSARAVVQTYVMQLRKQAAKAIAGWVDDPDRSARELVRTQPSGYMLAADDPPAGGPPQLALEPSPALRRLHRSMLVSDRAPNDLTDTWQATVVPQRRPTGPIPADLAATTWDIHPAVAGN